MKLTKELLQNMIRMVKMTRPAEIGCDECFDQLDSFAEMHLLGKTPEKAMPLVQDHLNKCMDCKEEYEALLVALKELRVDHVL